MYHQWITYYLKDNEQRYHLAFMVMIMIQKCKEMPYSLCLNLKLQVATTAAAFNIYYWTKNRDIGHTSKKQKKTA